MTKININVPTGTDVLITQSREAAPMITKPKVEASPADVAGTWTKFMDMDSGGSQKTPYAYIYIQGTEDKATQVFKKLFPDEDPNNVTCECCGEDFSVSKSDSLSQVTAHERRCFPLAEYINDKDVLIVYKDGSTNHAPKKNPKDFKRLYPKSPLVMAMGI